MDDYTTSRRRVLLGVGAGVGTLALAGCSGGGAETPAPGETWPASTATPTGDGPLPAPVKGNPDAEVTLAVYEDYACPHCADYNAEGFPELQAAYDGSEIRYEHHDLPIPVADPGSWQVASAAREVQARHGDRAFWNYAAALFDRSNEIRGDVGSLLSSIADDLGFDGEAISAAGVNLAHEETLTADRERGVSAGVSGTPGFVLDGEVVTSGFNADTISTVRSAIDDALSESG
jgi:protein-disulfide isomerase